MGGFHYFYCRSDLQGADVFPPLKTLSLLLICPTYLPINVFAMQKNTTIFRVLFGLLLPISISCVFAQTSCPGFPNMIQVKRPNLTIGTYIKGLLEYTPPGYNPLGTQR